MRILVLYGAFIAAALSLSAYDWPVRDLVLTSAFGANVGGRFRSGVEIGGEEQQVHPIERGEVIFTYEEGDHPGLLPTGIGSFLVIHHEGDLRSLYAHLEPGSVERKMKNLGPDDVLGIIGDSGDAPERTLRLAVYDTRLRQTVNPQVLLPPLADAAAPVIGELALDQESGPPIPLSPGMEVLEGGLILLADITDRMDPSKAPALEAPPYEVAVSVNGRQVYRIQYAAIREQEGVQLLDPERRRACPALYAGERLLRLGPVPVAEGDTVLEITAADLAGNSSARRIPIVVRKELRENI